MGSSPGCRPCGPGISNAFYSLAYAVLATASRSYPPPKGRFPCITHPCATCVLLHPFDLHVLGTPPAFVLSQDQTLSSYLIIKILLLITLSSTLLVLTNSYAEPRKLPLNRFYTISQYSLGNRTLFLLSSLVK